MSNLTPTIPGRAATLPICFTAGKKPPTPGENGDCYRLVDTNMHMLTLRSTVMPEFLIHQVFEAFVHVEQSLHLQEGVASKGCKWTVGKSRPSCLARSPCWSWSSSRTFSPGRRILPWKSEPSSPRVWFTPLTLVQSWSCWIGTLAQYVPLYHTYARKNKRRVIAHVCAYARVRIRTHAHRDRTRLNRPRKNRFSLLCAWLASLVSKRTVKRCCRSDRFVGALCGSLFCGDTTKLPTPSGDRSAGEFCKLPRVLAPAYHVGMQCWTASRVPIVLGKHWNTCHRLQPPCPLFSACIFTHRQG